MAKDIKFNIDNEKELIIKLFTGEEQCNTYSFNSDNQKCIIIGRDSSLCDVIIEDKMLSRIHCCVNYKEKDNQKGWYIKEEEKVKNYKAFLEKNKNEKKAKKNQNKNIEDKNQQNQIEKKTENIYITQGDNEINKDKKTEIDKINDEINNEENKQENTEVKPEDKKENDEPKNEDQDKDKEKGKENEVEKEKEEKEKEALKRKSLSLSKKNKN